MKLCNKCNIEKSKSEFYKDKYKKDGYKTHCIQCTKSYFEENKKSLLESRKVYYLNNKDKIVESKKVYREKNKEHFSEYRRKYYQDNIDRHKETSKINYNKNKKKILDKYKNRLDTDPFFKFIQNLKCNIRNSLTKTGYSKKTRTFEIIGMEFIQFREYIESQFKDGMSWDNYGEWHLDHKTPISWANSEDEAILLCHYSNYQPLWSFENISKGNRYKSD